MRVEAGESPGAAARVRAILVGWPAYGAGSEKGMPMGTSIKYAP